MTWFVPESGPLTLTVLSRVHEKVLPEILFSFTIITDGEKLPPEQIDAGVELNEIVGFGRTETVTVDGDALHPLAVGVIVKVTVWSVEVLLTKVPLMSPLPEFGTPVTLIVLLRVQLKTAPLTPFVLASTMVVIASSEQIVWAAGVADVASAGFTVTDTVSVADGQLNCEVAVSVKVTTIGSVVVLMSDPLMVAPNPLAPMLPVTMPTWSRVQLYVTVPGTVFGFVMEIALMAAPEQILCVAGAPATVGVGRTVKITVNVLSLQVPEAAVTV